MNFTLRLIPLGGLGEIGMNMMIYESEKELFIVDCGVMFPDSSLYGIDYLLPDFSYLRETKKEISGLIITHGHEDHIGGVPFLLKEFNIPIYAPRFAHGLLSEKFKEHNLSPSRMKMIEEEESIKLGKFKIDFIKVRHSIVDAFSLGIHTPLGTLIHTGDFKLDPFPVGGETVNLDRFASYGKEGVFLLLSDSTNVERSGFSTSEYEILEELERIFHQNRGRIIVSVFASNVQRIQQFVNLAKKVDRKISFDGRSMFTTTRIARDQGHLFIDNEDLIPLENVKKYPDHEILIITTGSQGEPRSALVRMARGEHRDVVIKKGDVVILSSKSIPGNERAISTLIDNLYRRGADVVYEKISNIHASGHAYEEELKMMLQLTKPSYFIPIHGHYRHLVKHSRLAEFCGVRSSNIHVITDGDIIEFSKEGAQIVDHYDFERIFVDGSVIGKLGHPLIKQRRQLSETGIVYVVLIRNGQTGEIVGGPDIFSQGFVLEHQMSNVMKEAKELVIEEAKKIDIQESDANVQENIRLALRRFFRQQFDQSPIVLPMVIDL
ncbi:MAG: ribonuclease J [Deltaproteobacteria bacterium]|nr:ribonuclease J [Deltaproteobacteria bacterium]